MRVAIDEARHHDSARRVDLDGSARVRQVLEAAGRPHLHQNAVSNQQPAVRYDPQFTEFGPRRGPLGARKVSNWRAPRIRMVPVSVPHTTLTFGTGTHNSYKTMKRIPHRRRTGR